jgi:hypothetical protein
VGTYLTYDTSTSTTENKLQVGYVSFIKQTSASGSIILTVSVVLHFNQLESYNSYGFVVDRSQSTNLLGETATYQFL